LCAHSELFITLVFEPETSLFILAFAVSLSIEGRALGGPEVMRRLDSGRETG
jgi:hypothetical protein